MKIRIMLLFAICLFIYKSTDVQAVTSDDSLIILDSMADEALQLTKANRYEETRQLLVNFEQMLLESSYSLNLSMDEYRMLQISSREALKILEKEQFAHHELVNSLTKLRLVVDAIATDYQPLWADMESSVMTAFQTVKKAVETRDSAYFHGELNTFLSVYDIIYPSILMDVPADKLQKVDARIQYIQQYSDELFASSSMDELNKLQADLEDLFNHAEEDEADPSLWWIIFSTGGIIIITLAYVGWRKYKGEREREQQYEKEHKN